MLPLPQRFFCEETKGCRSRAAKKNLNEREGAACSIAHRESLAEWVMESQQEENICLCWRGEEGGVNVSLQTALCVSAEVFDPRTVPPLTELGQKYERVV